MTLERAREMISQPLQFGGGYNRDAARLLQGEVAREHGQAAVDGLVRDPALETAFGLKPGTDFSSVGRRKSERAAPGPRKTWEPRKPLGMGDVRQHKRKRQRAVRFPA